jgi:uncharacterized membrane protein
VAGAKHFAVGMVKEGAVGNWNFDILRQDGWDLWVLVCVVAALAMGVYAVVGRLWTTRLGLLSLPMVLVGVVGTILVVAVPALHSPWVGLVWTLVILSLLSITFYLNLLPQLGSGKTAMLLGMRLVALVVLVPMLFEPVLRYVSRPKPERPLLFLVDASGSMSFPDVQNGPTRVQSVWQTIRPQLVKINDHFIPQFFTFATSVDPIEQAEDLSAVEAKGQATDLVKAVAEALQKTTRPDAAVILLSDGIDNTSPNVVEAVRASRRPIHTVSVGSDQTEPATLANIAVENIETADDFVVDHETPVRITIKSTALANRVVDVKMALIDEAGKFIGEMKSSKLVLQPLAEGQTVELSFKPEQTGVQRLAVWVDPVPGERSTVDNRQEFQGLALDPRVKVLYIEGRARPEYRELNRALGRDSNIEVASLLRIREDRFAASGTVDGKRITGLPSTLEEWKKFDVIILGDLDSSFLSKPQQTAIEQAVLDGAGLMMIGGQNSFGPGGYKDTPIEKALPVFVGELAAVQEKSEFVPTLTPEGVTHPAMETLDEWFAQEALAPTKTLPPLRGNVVVRGPKSGASVLLVHKDKPGPDGQPQIVLATQLYGKGRSAAFTADTTYLWYLPLRGLGQDSPYNKFWGQLVRWLAGEDVRNRDRGAGIEGLLNKSFYQLGETVRIRAMVRDEKGDATRYAQVNLVLKRVGSDFSQQHSLAPSESRTGMYDLSLPSLDKGEYTAELTASKDGKTLGTQTLKFTIIPPADEMLKIAANPKLMTEIAAATQGFHYPLAQFPTLIDELIRNDPNAATARQETVPLANFIRAGLSIVGDPPVWDKKYDLPLQGLLAVCILTAEWVMRRRWQLP